jgi:hypothetical protein
MSGISAGRSVFSVRLFRLPAAVPHLGLLQFFDAPLTRVLDGFDTLVDQLKNPA